jgi:lipid-binding SYLF domain-containing protein
VYSDKKQNTDYFKQNNEEWFPINFQWILVIKLNNELNLKTNKMKKVNITKTSFLGKHQTLTIVILFLMAFTVNAQIGGWNPELENEAKEALNTILEKTNKLETFKKEAYGYAVFPRITKAAAGVGGAVGNGIVYKDHIVVGKANLKQATIGFQFGGQQYIEVIFFENEPAFEKFTNGKLKLDAQASAVALKYGAAIDAAYQDGVAVFTTTTGGLMYEASIGGQHFKYKQKVEEQIIKVQP